MICSTCQKTVRGRCDCVGLQEALGDPDSKAQIIQSLLKGGAQGSQRKGSRRSQSAEEEPQDRDYPGKEDPENPENEQNFNKAYSKVMRMGRHRVAHIANCG